MTVPDLATVGARAAREGLAILGAFHPSPGDGAPAGTGTLVLLGPEPGAFWRIFSNSPEFRDSAPDALDRWSTRVIGGIAAGMGAQAIFPFGGPPFAPFFAWALQSGTAFTSPVRLLIHERLGLFVSYRGALALSARMPLPLRGSRPCDGCGQPCRSACPAGALTVEGYDVLACHAFLDTTTGRDCLIRGCAVRRACPIAPPQPEAQTTYHMTAFHGRQSR